jgi:ABC-type glutathione transport system ATPase component
MPSLGSIRRSFAPWEDPGAKPYISFQNVTKRFGDFTAVDNLSLDVYEREFFSLLGPSGCGKTTLLRMLAGFEEPTEGELYLDGQPLKGVPPHKRPVNMMFQSYALFPHMSVADNIAFGLKQDGMEKAARDERVAQMLKLVKLEEFARPQAAPAFRRPAPARRAGPLGRQAAQAPDPRRTARRARQEAARGNPVRTDGPAAGTRPDLHDRHP